MTLRYQKSLFIFRRDLRLHDNTALIQAAKQSHRVLPVFIFDDRQVGDENEYRSPFAIQFMIESLQDLATQLKKRNGQLYFFEGIAEQEITNIIEQEDIDAVFLNQDYTPFSIHRDATIERVCHMHTITFHSYHDALLTSPDEVRNKNNTPYAVFTAFFKTAAGIPVHEPQRLPKTTFATIQMKNHVSLAHVTKQLAAILDSARTQGGRTKATHILASLKKFKHYQQNHDIPSIETSHLSPHHKFGTLSIRESYHAIVQHLGMQHPLIRQLYWRDFFYHIAYHNPAVFGHAYRQKYEHLWWSKNQKHFTTWCEGRTGFPLVDAGMRQLNETGHMHNRVRLVVASFLTKVLHIHWLWGEKYFAQHLVDYDPCVNNGNWQWVASTGCDAQPYFRIFNPWLQQKKYDPECVYIKQWIPELKAISPAIIHNWGNDKAAPIPDYPRPIVDYAQESRRTKDIFRQAL